MIAFVLAAALAADPSASLRISKTGSLVHHVLCLAKVVQCQTDAYEKLWAALGKDKDDAAAFEVLRAIDPVLRRKHFGPDPFAEQSSFPMPAKDYDGHRRLRAEAFAAVDLVALKTALEQWLTKDEAAKITDALERFESRFTTHWQTAGKELSERSKSLDAWQPQLNAFAADAHRFFIVDPPVPAFVVYLVDRPPGARAGHADRLTDVAFVEVAIEDTTFDVARAAMVQLVKSFYAAATPKTHRDRQRAMSSIESDALLAAYTLLDDVLAYALTQSVLGKRLQQKPKSRTSPLVERLVVAAAPLLDAPFVDKTLDGRTAAKVVEAIIAAAEKELSSPKMALRTCEVAFDRALTDARRELTRALSAEQVVGYAPLDAPEVIDKLRMRHTSYMSVVWIVKPDDVPRLSAHRDFFDAATLATLKTAKGPIAYGVRRPVPTPAYVFVASTTDEFKALFLRFAAQPKPFVGVMH